MLCVSAISVRHTAACYSPNSRAPSLIDKLKFVEQQTPAPSPTPPPGDIFLVELANDKGQIKFGSPTRITDWVGYNNQPSFLPDGQSLFYTSIRAGNQADIYKYDLKSRTTVQVTDTPESEFSPTLTPDGHFISVVRVEADTTQRLWKFPIAGGKPLLVLEKIKPVGYHTWLSADTLALFVLGKPNTLQLVDARTEKSEIIAENIGRATRLIPRQHKISFVHKVSDQEWLIKSLDLKTRQITTLIKTLPGSEEYAWTPDGILLAGKDSKLFAWKPVADKDWREVADFSNAGLKGITRIAITSDGRRIAIVAHR
jgi:dipeptidyl aminopeptidase/acylaminoacyl peptidase